MDKFKNKYRIQSNRMAGWDYSGNGYYFITIVTQNRECNLGKIIKTHNNAYIKLSDFGNIVENEWYKSFEMRNELFLDEFVLMPNHLHAIIVLEKTIIDNPHNDLHHSHVETHGRASLQNNRVSLQNNRASLQQQSKLQPPVFIRKPKSISSFIGGFKSVINSKIDDYIDKHNLNIPKYNRNNHFFQPNYNDHIIRNNTEYKQIKNYIIKNPSNWKQDKLYE